MQEQVLYVTNAVCCVKVNRDICSLLGLYKHRSSAESAHECGSRVAWHYAGIIYSQYLPAWHIVCYFFAKMLQFYVFTFMQHIMKTSAAFIKWTWVIQWLHYLLSAGGCIHSNKCNALIWSRSICLVLFTNVAGTVTLTGHVITQITQRSACILAHLSEGRYTVFTSLG